MINNLFSTFDPSASLISLSWTIFAFVLLILNPSFWIVNPISHNINSLILNTINNEVNFALINTENGTEVMIITAFLAILSINVIALFPQNFSLTSHVSVNTPIALLFWLTLTLNGWLNNHNHILTHLVPQGTPPLLIPFIVLIEITSTLIRPITLCVRLTANLIAGHLLITLLGNLLSSMGGLNALLSLALPLTLTILETAVACIQAYVFITLITMYTTEIN